MSDPVILSFRISITSKLRQHQSLITVQGHADTPGIDEQQQRISLHILDLLHIRSTGQFRQVDLVFIFNPADMLVRQILQTNFHIIFVFQTVFQHIELQYTYHTYDNFFQTGIELLEDLDGTLLGDLLHTLDEHR